MKWQNQPLRKKYQQVDPGDWTSNDILLEMKASCDWGIRPSDLGICEPDEDLLMMSAYVKTVAEMTAVDLYEQNKDIKSKV